MTTPTITWQLSPEKAMTIINAIRDYCHVVESTEQASNGRVPISYILRLEGLAEQLEGLRDQALANSQSRPVISDAGDDLTDLGDRGD